MQLNGSEIVMQCLLEQGVDTVFGYPGGTILNIYDALYKHSDEIRHILSSHEQGAAHMADGYARATGKVGVCFATSGPGATNLVTGIATAYMDSIPVVAITANVTTDLLGRDSFQEIDIAGITMPVTKHNYIVKDVNQLADTIRAAFRIARSGRPGPVLVDITKDVTANMAEYTFDRDQVVFKDETKPAKESEIETALSMLEESKCPCVLVGGGTAISGAQEQLARFVELLDAPVCDTLMGKGCFSGENPNYTGMLGMHGTKASNLTVTKCDLLVVAGARFSDRVTGNTKRFAPNARILQIDIDPAEIDKNVKTSASVIGDIKQVLEELNARLHPCHHSEWLAEVRKLQEKYPLTYCKDRLTGPYVIEKLYEITKGDAIITTEVGQNQMWTAQFYHFKNPRSLITSGGLGTMGYGLGASIGAKVGRPDQLVINVAGDGCFRMNMNELATAVRNNVPIIEVIINNHVLGMVYQWQDLFYDSRYSCTVIDDAVDFVKLAEAMGARGCRVTAMEEVEPAIREAIASGRPSLIECVIDSEDKVFPMVAPGAAIEEAFAQEDLDKQT